MFRQRHDILDALAQRRHAQANLPQTVIQVAAELPVLHHGLQILIGGGHNAHVNGHFSSSTQPVVCHAIQDSQQLHLHAGFQLAHFVQEQRSVVCQFEQPRLGRIRAAEGASFVAEQFTFHQMLGQRRATDIHPGLGAAQRVVVHGSGDYLFAGTAFAGNQNSCIGLRDPLHQFDKLQHPGAGNNRRHA